MPAPGQSLQRRISPAFSQRLLEECLAIVAALEPPADLRDAVFQAAVAHAGQLEIVDGPVQVARNADAFRSRN